MFAANSPAQLFQRHASIHCYTDIYSDGELFISNEHYATAESAYYTIGENLIIYASPACALEYSEDGGLVELLMPPEDRAVNLEYYQTCINLTEGEVFEACEDQAYFSVSMIWRNVAWSSFMFSSRPTQGKA